MTERCFGNGPNQALYAKYHDTEWGKPSHDETHLFEMLILEGAQAGLSWEIILKRREGYRQLFHEFDPNKVANMTDAQLHEICQNPKVIRNRLKISSARQNARVFLEIQKEMGSFDNYVWGFVNHKPIVNTPKKLDEMLCFSDVSEALSKDLRKRGMNFVGPLIMYSFMQAIGMVNDHLISCPHK